MIDSVRYARYGWGKNAPKLSLPHGVGYSVGGDSSLEYLVLQVKEIIIINCVLSSLYDITISKLLS